MGRSRKEIKEVGIFLRKREPKQQRKKKEVDEEERETNRETRLGNGHPKR